MAKKRAWSTEFTPKTEKNYHINISGVPKTLRDDFARNCRVKKVSQRNLILGWIKQFNAGRMPFEDTVPADEAARTEGEAVTVV